MIVPLGGLVAYSRVHTGVHYPSDVVVGAGIGAAAGLAGARIVAAARRRSVHYADTPPLDVRIPGEALLLASPHAGAARHLDAPLTELQRAGVRVVQRMEVGDSAALAELLRGEHPPALVLAAGGDGTVGAAADAVAGTNTLVGVIPLGTSNDVARSLGIPTDPVSAARLIAAGRVRAVDLGCVELSDGSTRHFVNSATAGLNVAFARLATTSWMRDRFRGLTYPVAAAMAVRQYEPFGCTLEYERPEGGAGAPGLVRETLDLVHLSASNATVFGGVLGIRVPRASMTDGLLDVIALSRLSRARLGLAVGDTLIGRHAPVQGVRALRVRSVRVSLPASVGEGTGKVLAADGEVLGPLLAEISVRPGALRIITPARDGE